jgi:phage/plasmid-like protein (TIGR03299 family)
MAHMVETMAYAGELPWHGLGVPVSNDLTPAQMQQKAGLDWNVEKVDAFVNIGGQQVKTGQQALVRTSDNTILTNVGEGWNPVQNSEAFDFFTDFVMEGDMEMHTAGSLKNGQIVWALAKVKESFDIFGEDRVDAYFLFSNPHQYGKAIDVRFTPIRVVCNNTLTMSLNTESERAVKIGHRTSFDADLVKEKLGLATEKFAKYKEMAQFLGSKRFKVEDLIQYYNEVLPSTSRKEAEPLAVTAYDDLSRGAKMCYDALETQPGAEYGAGTWWQAFNSVTYFTDHHQGRNAENRLHSQWFGGNQLKKVKAAEKAVQYAMAS